MLSNMYNMYSLGDGLLSGLPHQMVNGEYFGNLELKKLFRISDFSGMILETKQKKASRRVISPFMVGRYPRIYTSQRSKVSRIITIG